MDPKLARKALLAAVNEIAASLKGLDGLHLFHASYVDLVVAAESPRGPLTLVAGNHTAHFPYDGAEPWDNALLYVGAEGYTFTGRDPGAALAITVDRDVVDGTGSIDFNGEMRRAASGEAVTVELHLPITTRRFPERALGEAYNILDIEGLIGMRWMPWSITGGEGTLRIAGDEIPLTFARGSAERGELNNLRAEELALRYDYVALAKPGSNGYGLIYLQGHALHPGSIVGNILDTYLSATTTATITFVGDAMIEGNPRGVIVPPPGDAAALLFEDMVDLGAARLHRQMVKTRDASGEALFGLREIFVAKGG